MSVKEILPPALGQSWTQVADLAALLGLLPRKQGLGDEKRWPG